MSRLSVPNCSPLATGWRRQLAELLAEVGIADVMDAIAAYGEYRDRCDSSPRHDLFERLTEWEGAAPCRRRIHHTAIERGHCKL